MKRVFLIGMLVLLVVPLISSEMDKNYLCEKTYEGIMENKTNYQIIDRIIYETGVGMDESLINYYRNYWESLCQERISKVLNPKELCENIYFFVLEKKWEFNEYQIKESMNFSYNIISNYLDNNYNLCVYENYSSPLPKRSLKEVKIYLGDNCSLKLKPFFELSMPFFNIPTQKECREVQFANKFFIFQDKGFGLNVVGIRVYFVFIIAVILMILLFLFFGKIIKGGNT